MCVHTCMCALPNSVYSFTEEDGGLVVNYSMVNNAFWDICRKCMAELVLDQQMRYYLCVRAHVCVCVCVCAHVCMHVIVYVCA